MSDLVKNPKDRFSRVEAQLMFAATVSGSDGAAPCLPNTIFVICSCFHLFSIMDAHEFEWESQLRFYWVKEPDELMVRQCTGEFGYGYEYMGLNGRLVITPLTDRIYLTLTQVNRTKNWFKLVKSFSFMFIISINMPCLRAFWKISEMMLTDLTLSTS